MFRLAGGFGDTLSAEAIAQSADAAEADARIALEMRDQLPNGEAIARDLDAHARAIRRIATFAGEVARADRPGPDDDRFEWDRFYRLFKAYFTTRRRLRRTMERSVPNVGVVGHA